VGAALSKKVLFSAALLHLRAGIAKMKVVLVNITLFVLCAASFWRASVCQDLNAASSRLANTVAVREAMESLDEVDREDMDAAFHAIKTLWTDRVPLLLQEWTESPGNSMLSEECVNDTLAIYRMNITVYGMNFPGSGFIPLADATGKQGAGLLQGNFLLDGAYDECFSYNYTAFCLADPIKVTPAIEKYEPVLQLLGWSVGMCVPKRCGTKDIKLLLQTIELLDTNDTVVLCTETKTPEYSIGAIVMLCVTLLFLVLVMVGSTVDVILKNFESSNIDNSPNSINGDPSINRSNGVGDEKKPLLHMQREKKGPKVKPQDFIVAFSLFRTVPTLLGTKQNAGVITSLNGLRVISMFWVIVGHTLFWLFQTDRVRVDNLLEIRTLLERFTFQAINPGAFFAVDTFFFLSGILVAYIIFRQMDKKKGRFPFLQYYLHRYLRLTPSYGFILFFAWFMTPYLSYGPRMTLHNPYAAQCEKYWWTNFLYINNLYPWELKEQCVGWSWYLANDMQFYVISPILLITAYKIFPVSLILNGVLMACGFLVTGTLVGVYDFQGNSFSAVAYNYTQKASAPTTYTDAIYIKPWGRIGPYLVGIILGYVLYKKYKIPLRSRILNRLVYSSIWGLSTFVAFWLVYGLYFTWHGHIPSPAENIVYITFGRVLWSLCMTGVVFACHNGYGWFVNSFLSMKMWIPLARITYNAYLVHPVVLTVVYGQLQTPLHYTDVSIASYAVAFVTLSYAAAGMVCIVVEFPLGTIETKIFDLFGSMRRESLRQNHEEFEKSRTQSLPHPART